MSSNQEPSGQTQIIDDNLVRALSAMPVGAVLINAARDTVVCNADFLRLLNLPETLARVPMSTDEFGAQLAEHTYQSNDAGGITKHLRGILAGVEVGPRRHFATWINGRKTIIETVGTDGLIWMFVKEQLDEVTSKRNEAQLVAAVENIGQGLVMLDGHRRVVVCNTDFARLYNLTENQMVRGTRFAEIEGTEAERGVVIEPVEDFFDQPHQVNLGCDPEADNCFVERVNGRLIRVLIKTLPDGGSVSTHLDITDQVEQNLDKAKKQAEIEQQHMRLDATVDAIPHGLAMFDAEHRLVVCNDAFIDINRLDAELAVPGARRDDLIANSNKNGFAATGQSEQYFQARAEAIAAGKPVISQVELTDGRSILVGHHPTSDGGWVSFHQDVSELRAKQALVERRSEELELHNQRFKAAINNMALGLAMFDGEKRMVVCNEPFGALYHLPDHLCQPGTHFHDILRHRASIGMIGDDAEIEPLIEQLDKVIAAGEMRRDTIHMKTGQIFDILHQSLPDGGWVATHQDITEQKRSEQLIAESNAELQRQHMRFTAAVGNMTHGLSMFDAERKLVICNEAYAELYGLPVELTRPGTSFWDMLDHGAQSGMVSIADAAERRRVLEDVINEAKPVRGPVRMVNGRVMQVLHQPTADGGWLATHEDITEEHNSAELIEHMAHHDPLTDLPNRLSFSERLERAEAQIRRGDILALVCLDLDHFKEVNDTLGHSYGDRVLQEVARRINVTKRESEFAARMGGDEFMLLLGPLEKPQHAATVAQRLIDAISEPIELDGHLISIGTSIGISVAPEDGTDGETLMRNADLSLYRAKAEGRGNYCFFEQGMDAQMQERRKLESGMRDALAKQDFTLAFQPLLDLNSNRVSGFEALLRWTHPELGVLPPSKFIPIAEETGLIVPLGRWVMRTACEVAVNWPEHVHVAVNLSPAQFKDKRLVQSVADILEATGLAADRLELEITESLLLQNAEGNLKVLHELRKMGVRISMDDFGTGYSALSYLRSFPFDKIKIDRSFIGDISSRDNNDLVSAVIGLGRSLGVMTTAEGVETELQLDIVRENGCSEVQGFLFSPPLPASAATELLQVTEARAAEMAGVLKKEGSSRN